MPNVSLNENNSDIKRHNFFRYTRIIPVTLPVFYDLQKNNSKAMFNLGLILKTKLFNFLKHDKRKLIYFIEIDRFSDNQKMTVCLKNEALNSNC